MSNQDPMQGINKAFETQMALKNDPERNYHKQASSYAIDIVETFRQLFPGVEIKSVVLREKSGKSLLDKIKSLQIERFSKLAVVEADIPDILHEAEIHKYGEIQPLNFKALYPLFADRMDENIVPADNSPESIEEANVQSSFYKHCIRHVLNSSIQTPADADELFEKVEEIFSEPRISKNTKTAIARIMYAKIKQGILPESYKITNLDRLSRKYGSKAKEEAINHATADTLKQAEDIDYLNLDAIIPIEQDKYDLSETLYDNTYTSKLDRLLDEQEFIQPKDVQGMQIIISSIPRNFQTKNRELKALISAKNHEQDAIEIFGKSFSDLTTLEKIYIAYLNSDQSGQKDKPNSEKDLDTSPKTMNMLRTLIESFHNNGKLADFQYSLAISELEKGLTFKQGSISDFPSYIKLDQECMAEISREFAEYMEKHSANWLKQHNNSLLVRDSFKHKDKVNGYVADHFKIAMEGKKEKPLEVHIKSKYVEAKCKFGKEASHAARIGKQRITPELLNDPFFASALQNKHILEAYMLTTPKEDNVLQYFMKELDFLLPKYTVLTEDPETHRYVANDLTTSENAAAFYEGVIMNDNANQKVLINLIKAAEDYNITISTSPKKIKPNIDTSDDSDSQSPLAASTRVSHDDPDF